MVAEVPSHRVEHARWGWAIVSIAQEGVEVKFLGVVHIAPHLDLHVAPAQAGGALAVLAMGLQLVLPLGAEPGVAPAHMAALCVEVGVVGVGPQAMGIPKLLPQQNGLAPLQEMVQLAKHTPPPEVILWEGKGSIGVGSKEVRHHGGIALLQHSPHRGPLLLPLQHLLGQGWLQLAWVHALAYKHGEKEGKDGGARYSGALLEDLSPVHHGGGVQGPRQ